MKKSKKTNTNIEIKRTNFDKAIKITETISIRKLKYFLLGFSLFKLIHETKNKRIPNIKRWYRCIELFISKLIGDKTKNSVRRNKYFFEIEFNNLEILTKEIAQIKFQSDIL